MNIKLSFAVIVTILVVIVNVEPLNKGKLEFKVSGRNLPDKDIGFGTSDGYFEVFSSEDGGNTRNKIGRSDTISNQENPDWGNVFHFDFDRDKDQLWYFKVYDDDTLRTDDNVGRVWVSVRDYVDKDQFVNANLHKGGYLTIQSVHPQLISNLTFPRGSIPLIPGEPKSQTLQFKLSASELRTKDDILFIPGKSDPYVIVYVAEGVSGNEVEVGRSTTLGKTSNPSWGDVFTLNWNYDKEQRLHFSLFDNDNLRSDDNLGSAWIEVNDYVARGQSISINIPKGGKITINKA